MQGFIPAFSFLKTKTPIAFGFGEVIPVDKVKFFSLGIATPHKISLDFNNGFSIFLGQIDVLHHMGRNTNQGRLGEDSPTYHVKHVGFSTGHLFIHGVQDELEVFMGGLM